MKKLRKLNLKSTSVMDDNEMKMIVGGSGLTNDCPSGSSESKCVAACVIYDDNKIYGTGYCHHVQGTNVCA